jgi:hypothetical protein
MSKIMYANYAAIKNEQHIPDAVAQSDLKNGYVVVKGVDEKGKHTATVPGNETECKGELWFVWNTVDKPELDNESDFVIKKDDFARIFKFKADYPIYVSKDLITGEVKPGKYLVADETKAGMLKIADAATGYKVALLVTEPLTSAQGVIYLCDVVIGTPTTTTNA